MEQLDEDTILKTIPINTFSIKSGQIESFASGSIIEYLGKHIVITVAHCTNEERIIGINLEAYQGKPNILFFSPYPVKKLQVTEYARTRKWLYKLFYKKYKKLSDVFEKCPNQYDLLYSDIPTTIKPKHNDIHSRLFNKEKRLTPIQFPIVIEKKKEYKFYGMRFVGFYKGQIIMNDVYINDMKLIDRKGDYLFFKTNKKIDNTISGCSGAPILDENGKMISMVIAQDGDIITGLELNQLKAILDASYDGGLYGK